MHSESQPDQTQDTAPAAPRPVIPASRILATRKFLSPAEARESLDQFARFATDPTAAPEHLQALATSLRESGYAAETAAVLDGKIKLPGAHPCLGTLWMRRLTTSKSWDRTYPAELDELVRLGPVGEQAIFELLRYAAERSKPHLVLEVCRRHASHLHKNPEAWLRMGCALASVGAYRKGLRWLDRGAQPEVSDLRALNAKAHCLRGLGHERQSLHIIQQAITGHPPERLQDRFPQLLVWAAMEEALAGDLSAAAQHLAGLEPAAWDDTLNIQFYLARGVLRVKQAEPAMRAQSFRQAYDRVRERFRKIPVHRHDRATRRAYRRCLWRMAIDSGNYRRALLSAWRAADSPLPLLPLTCVPGLQLLLPVYLFRWLRSPSPLRRR